MIFFRKFQSKIKEEQIIKHFCIRNDLSTYDPYDIWKISFGIKVKKLFNTNRILGAIPALILTLYDQMLNNRLRFGYKKQEYPIVRALTVQILLNEYQRSNEKDSLDTVKKNLEWLKINTSKGYSGACWGLGFRWSVSKDIFYDGNTPHTTHTPYALEAFHNYTKLTNNLEFIDIIKSCFMYYEKTVVVMYDDDVMMAVSYGPFKDRIVINASSYTLYAYTIFLEYFPEKRDYIKNKILKLFRFIQLNQNSDGSWMYLYNDKKSFIDCFHSCIIIKNLIKANNLEKIEGLNATVEKGYRYINEHFLNTKYGLYKRFTNNNKVTFTKFDLYDNAEALTITSLMGDTIRSNELKKAINYHFIDGKDIYSVIDYLGFRRNKNTLRWAVMPYLFALSSLKINT